MVFSSAIFLFLFLPVTFLAYQVMPGLKAKNGLLILASLIFYSFGQPRYLLLLLASVTINYAAGLLLQRESGPRKGLLAAAVIANVGILAVFKYLDFVLGNLNVFLDASLPLPGIILPIGISFYTFQGMSYIIDVYRDPSMGTRNFGKLLLYISFFPQLVAGPIIKYHDISAQISSRHTCPEDTAAGIRRFIVGLSKKLLIANTVGAIADSVYAAQAGSLDMRLAWLGAVCYTLQIYFNFSGYSDMAIGMGRIFGFRYLENFEHPYVSSTIREFWKRWHISLSRWLQTYLYIPLGGNRNITFGTYFWIIVITLAALVLSGSWWVAAVVLIIAMMVIYTAYRHPERRKKIYANLNAMITMLLGGLWHGASLNFVIWGGLNGVGMVVYKFWRDNSPLWRVCVSMLVVLLLVVLMWLAPAALWNVLIVCAAFIAISAVIRWLYAKYNKRERNLKWLANSWAILVTFTFISFTRLFFRSGSNLDPATANEVAWKTAKSMVQQMGTAWDVNVLDVLWGYHNVFLLFVLGMVVHWLPVKVKRRYRLTFASLPLPVMMVTVAVVVFFVYQFVTAEMQPFIYFQF